MRSRLTTCACTSSRREQISRERRLRIAVGNDACGLVRVAAGRGVLLTASRTPNIDRCRHCARIVRARAGRPALALLYPDVNAPRAHPARARRQRADARFSRPCIDAARRRIYWHLDGRYLGETHTFHQQSLDIDPGEHILTLVDDTGERVARRFQVLATRNRLLTRVSCSMDLRSRHVETDEVTIRLRTAVRVRHCCCCMAFRRRTPCGRRSRRASREDFTVVCPDLRGYGGSSKPESTRQSRALFQARHGARPGRGHEASSASKDSTSRATTAAVASPIDWRSIHRPR